MRHIGYVMGYSAFEIMSKSAVEFNRAQMSILFPPAVKDQRKQSGLFFYDFL